MKVDKMNISELLIDSHHGIYIPQIFSEECDKVAPLGEWKWNRELIKDLSDPDNEFYNEAWSDVLDTAKFESNTQGIYHLEQFDGDVWLVRDGFYMNESGMFNDNDEEVDEEGNVIVRMKCDQCNMLSISGMATHETGCPNEKKRWVVEDGEGKWVLYVKCFECGFEVEEGTQCDCQQEIETEDENEND
jgi:hypothetical protein